MRKWRPVRPYAAVSVLHFHFIFYFKAADAGEGDQVAPVTGFIETDDQFGPFGAKGIGEPGLVPTAPAIANAIYDAVGVRIKELPITPEKVLAALREKGKK